MKENNLLENLFEREIRNVSCKDNSVKLSQSKISETESRNSKRPLKINNVRNNSNREPIKTFNKFDCLSEDESLNEILEANDADEKIISRNKSGKSDTQVKNKYNSGFHRRKGNQRIGNNTKKVTVLVGDSIIKDIKGWEISDRENKFVVRHFPGAKTDDMISYVVPKIKQNPETIAIHSGTNDLKTEKDHRKIADNILGLAHQCKADDNTVMISGIVPRDNNLNDDASKVNKIFREVCSKRNIGFIDNENINPRYNCNRSKLHLKLNILFSLYNDISD